MVLRAMLIYEISRHIHSLSNIIFTLSCTFPSGHEHINVIVIWNNKSEEIQKFKLDPETPIEVSVPLIRKYLSQ